MPFLTSGQAQALHAVRGKFWTVPVVVENLQAGRGLEPEYAYDDPPDVSLPPVTIYGDIVWREQYRAHGTPGGVADTGLILVTTDLAYANVVQTGSRVVVNGARCAITEITHFEDTQEMVFKAKRLERA